MQHRFGWCNTFCLLYLDGRASLSEWEVGGGSGGVGYKKPKKNTKVFFGREREGKRRRGGALSFFAEGWEGEAHRLHRGGWGWGMMQDQNTTKGKSHKREEEEKRWVGGGGSFLGEFLPGKWKPSLGNCIPLRPPPLPSISPSCVVVLCLIGLLLLLFFFTCFFFAIVLVASFSLLASVHRQLL